MISSLSSTQLILLILCVHIASVGVVLADDVTPIISVISPAYGAEITGDTPVQIAAPGMKHATVRCWQSGPDLGSDSVVAEIDLDTTGAGKFVFPASRYPHGPLMIRISGQVGSAPDTCILQVYNRSGTQWHEGLPSTPPPAAQGMALLFADDFTKMPTISPDGRGATYNAHKPGGGDFSKLPFVSVNEANNPFKQVDTYLRIRADQAKNSTGLLASVNADYAGVTARAPCYFECRFVAQSAPGTWPAFWLVSRPEPEAYPGLSDEYDIIEAYGGTGPRQPNFPGYEATSHYWNQQANGKPVPDDAKKIDMTKLSGGSTWYDTFHTYGMKITEAESIYYLDDREVYRYPTHSPLVKDASFFFLINYAVGGASGWPVDLGRYQGVADMYVDYVRVYSGAPKPDYAAPGLAAGLKTKGIGLNFAVTGGSSTELEAKEVAGESHVSQGNWNNLAGAGGTLQHVKDQVGREVGGMSATWSVPPGDTAWRSQAGREWGFGGTNWKLQKGYIQVSGRLALTNIPYAKYDVYVYLGAGDNGGSGSVSISSAAAAGKVDLRATCFYRVGWLDGKFVRSEATNLATVKDSNLVVFSGNTAKDIALDWIGNLAGGWTGVTGVQIVAVP